MDKLLKVEVCVKSTERDTLKEEDTEVLNITKECFSNIWDKLSCKIDKFRCNIAEKIQDGDVKVDVTCTLLERVTNEMISSVQLTMDTPAASIFGMTSFPEYQRFKGLVQDRI